MIKRGRDNTQQMAVERIHDGEGTGYVRQLLGMCHGIEMPGWEDDFDTLISFVHEVRIPPGVVIGPHRHFDNEEVYVIVQGEGEMTVDGETEKIKPGDAVLTKSGSVHSFTNSGPNDALLIVFEAVMKPEGKKKQGYENVSQA